jgi:hypothetical protein
MSRVITDEDISNLFKIENNKLTIDVDALKALLPLFYEQDGALTSNRTVDITGKLLKYVGTNYPTMKIASTDTTGGNLEIEATKADGGKSTVSWYAMGQGGGGFGIYFYGAGDVFTYSKGVNRLWIRKDLKINAIVDAWNSKGEYGKVLSPERGDNNKKVSWQNPKPFINVGINADTTLEVGKGYKVGGTNDVTVTLPKASETVDEIINIKAVGSGTVTVAVDSSTNDKIDGFDNLQLDVMEAITVQSTGNTWYVIGRG